MKRIGAFDRCGCKDERGWPHYYETCPVHGEAPYDRSAREARSKIWEGFRTTAMFVGFFALWGVFISFTDRGSIDPTQPIAETIHDAAGQAALRAVLWTLVAVSAIVFVIDLVAEARDRPRYRR